MGRRLALLAVGVAASARAAAPPAGASLAARVGGFDSEVKNFLARSPKATADWNAESQTVMTAANSLVEELSTGEKSEEKKHFLEEVIGDLETWQQKAAVRAKAQEGVMKQHDADFLMKLLVQRQHLPMATQLAVLRRKDTADIKWTQVLLKNHTDQEPLAEQLRALLRTDHLDSGVHSALPAAGSLSKDEARRETQVQHVKEQLSGLVTKLTKTADGIASHVDPKDAVAAKELASARAELKAASATGAGPEGKRTLTLPERLHALARVGDELKAVERRVVASHRH